MGKFAEESSDEEVKAKPGKQAAEDSDDDSDDSEQDLQALLKSKSSGQKA